MLAVPPRLTGLGPALSAAAALVKAAEAEAAAITADLDEPERDALRRAFGEGSTGKGVAKAIRGAAGAMKELEDRQKSRATRLKRDALDRALLDLAAFYRDVLAVQVGAAVDLASAGHEADVRRLAEASLGGGHGAPDPGRHDLPGAAGAQRGAAARRRGDDPRPGRRPPLTRLAAAPPGVRDHDFRGPRGPPIVMITNANGGLRPLARERPVGDPWATARQCPP